MKTKQHELGNRQSNLSASSTPDLLGRGSKCGFVIALLIGILEALHATPAQWQASQGGNGHWYEAVLAGTNRITWTSAKAAAERAGGHLATITSLAENAFVHGLIATNESFWTGGEPWLGGYQPAGSAEPAGGWQWVTSEPWSFLNWESGEPNNFSGPENFLAFWQTPSGRTSRWNDSQDVPMPGHVVEWEFPPPLDFNQGLLAYYPFDGNANDASGNGHHGTPLGSPSFAADRFGAPNNAIQLDGAEDSVWLGSGIRPSNITVSVWFRTSQPNPPTSPPQWIIRDRACGWGLVLGSPPGQPSVAGNLAVYPFSASVCQPEIFMPAAPAQNLNDGQWHIAVITYDGVDLALYVDGVNKGLTHFPVAGGIQYGSGGLAIGRDGDEQAGYFNGEVDEVRIYGRALSSFEILALGADGTPRVTAWPTSETVSTGANANFGVSALGTLPLSYQWSVNGTPLPGKTAPTLSLTEVQSDQTGNYSVTVSNAFGSTNVSATLSVLDLKMFAGLVLAGPVGTNYKVEYIPTIGGTNTWQTLTNVTLTTSPSVFFDMESPNESKRFYRATAQP